MYAAKTGGGGNCAAGSFSEKDQNTGDNVLRDIKERGRYLKQDQIIIVKCQGAGISDFYAGCWAIHLAHEA